MIQVVALILACLIAATWLRYTTVVWNWNVVLVFLSYFAVCGVLGVLVSLL